MLSSPSMGGISADMGGLPVPPPVPATGQEFVASGVTNTNNADVLPKLLNIYLPLEGVFVPPTASTPPQNAAEIPSTTS